MDAMKKKAAHSLRKINLCLWLVILLLAWGSGGCTTKALPLTPGAAAFKKEVREIITRLTPALTGPLARSDAQAAEQAILSLYPTAGQDQDDFPFQLGAMSKEGVLVATLPPVKLIGADFINYQLVQETLSNRRINKKRLYSPDDAPVYFVLAPIMANDNFVGLVALRLTATQALKKWGITESEFQAMDLN
jgi:hypothetical protein